MPSRDTTCPECQEHHGAFTASCPYYRDLPEEDDDTEPTSDEIDAWIEHCYGSR